VVVLTVRRIPGLPGLIGIVLLVGLVVLIIKWALITAAILVVPFGVWWLLDRHRAAERGRATASGG
jgi:Flp pilus assembly protein TadB